jgi:hypothetical protein
MSVNNRVRGFQTFGWDTPHAVHPTLTIEHEHEHEHEHVGQFAVWKVLTHCGKAGAQKGRG